MDFSKQLSELGKHVSDTTGFHFPRDRHWELRSIAGFQITRYMVLELVAALLMILIFVAIARRLRRGGPPRGLFWNLFEVMLVFIRNEVARPAIGKHDADRFLPFLWNVFFFVLFCNLLGILPWAGSPTGSIAVTGVMALMTFCVVVGAGMLKLGAWGYVKALVPHMDMPMAVKVPVLILLFPIEVAGLLIRHVVLAVRLMANMFAGHLVLGIFLSFIALTAGTVVWWGVTPLSVLAAVALTFLEIFVAFLQAYIFAFLSALFIGMAVHPH